MSGRDWRDRIEDMLRAIAEVEGFAAGLSFDEFRADTKALKAAAMDFIVIGEAATQMPADVPPLHPPPAPVDRLK